ncbi:MAG: hypothetical protein AABX72_01355 [Nanoarchaeota archaeon]
MMGCNKCTKASGWIFLILGVLFLLQNMQFWDFWGIQWFTALFIVMGIAHIGMSKCADCQAVMRGSGRKR